MVFLLELKEGFKKFYNKYDTYLVPAVRFVMALVSFLMLNASIGYMSKLKNPWQWQYCVPFFQMDL